MLITKGMRNLKRRTRSTFLLLLIFLAGLILGQPVFHTHNRLLDPRYSHAGSSSLVAEDEAPAHHLPVYLVCIFEKTPALHTTNLSPRAYFPLENETVYPFFCPKVAGDVIQPVNRAPPIICLTSHHHDQSRPLPV